MMTHQAQRFSDGRLRLVGDSGGRPYSVMLDLDAQTAEWEHDQAPHTPAPLPSDQRPGEKPCVGCVSAVQKLLRGGWGWAKSVFKQPASAETIARREEICEACPSGCYRFGVCRDDWPNRPAEEQGCGCILSLKVLVADEECPHKHW